MDIYSVFSLIERLHKHINQSIVLALKQEGYDELVPSHGEILFAVLLHGRLTMKGVSELIRRDKSTVTVLVRKLEKLGYLKKETDVEDSRVFWIVPTPKAEDFKPVFLKVSNELISLFYAGYEVRDKEQLCDFLIKSLSNFQAK